MIRLMSEVMFSSHSLKRQMTGV